jgi:hypothetical protein
MNRLAFLPVIAAVFVLAPGPSVSDASRAKAAFERLKSLEGEWDSYSTRGWAGDVRYQVIAGGSAVLAVSRFEEAHPGESMATVYHFDGDRLMLTHYCIAKNQPRLFATEIGEGGQSVTFTFRDATNLPSRDRGHMDSAIYTFPSPDRFTSRWTFMQNGKASWMEEIRHDRRAARATGAGTGAGKN